MANSNTEHSKKLRAATAAAAAKKKLQSGAYRQYTIRAKAAEMDVIDAAIAKAGGSRTQALLKICREWLDNQAT
ncbi:MAG: hypothetical protein Q4A62_10175 [Eikenella sp.]|nr:hypothetical protein [Eikenella sp.]